MPQRTAASPPLARPATVRQAYWDRLGEDPGGTAYTFLTFPVPGAPPVAAMLTRAELDLRARGVAAGVAGTGAPRVLLAAEPGLDFVTGLLGCLYAGVCVVPVAPLLAAPAGNGAAVPGPDAQRLLQIARDADAGAVLATAAGRPSVEVLRGAGVPGAATALALADLATAGTPDWRAPDVDPDGLALLQYTSGSTGGAKAVAVSHTDLVTHLSVFQQATGMPAGGAVVSWISVFHALGLAGHLLFAGFLGGHATFMRPDDFIAEPARWLRAIAAASGPVFAGAPNFAYQRCVDQVRDEQCHGLDLSGWHTALNAAERIRPQTLAGFQQKFGRYGFRPETMFPGYGMTETMLLISGRHGPDPLVAELDATRLEQHEAVPAGPGARRQALVGNGFPVAGQEILVVDPQLATVCPDGRVGEVWIRGPIVARGYWRRPELTEAVFGARLADGTGPFLRTGDLAARYRGELVLCGRLKETIIIRGRNLYPQDLAATAADAHPAAGTATAFSVDVDGAEALVIVQALAPGADPAQAGTLAAAVRTAVASAHQVEVHRVLVVPPGQIPVTPGGKVRQVVARQAYRDGGFTPLAVSEAPAAVPGSGAAPGGAAGLGSALALLGTAQRRSVVAAVVTRRLADALGVPADAVEADRPLAGCGLESLRAIELRRDLERDFGVAVPMAEVLLGTPAGLAGYVAGQLDQAGPVPAETPGADPEPGTGTGTGTDAQRYQPFPLTELQQAYYVGRAAGFALGNVSIHFYAEFDRADLDPDRLRRALERLVHRQEMLRAVIGDDGTQRILPVDGLPEVALPVADLRGRTDVAVAEALRQIRDELSHQVFPVGQWPMFEVRVSRLDAGWRTHVSLDLLVADVASVRLFFQEWGDFYADEQRPAVPPGVSFRDCVLAARPDPAEVRRAWAYWRGRIATLPPGPVLPVAAARPDRDERTRVRLSHLLPAADWARLRERAAAHGVTPSTALLAVYAHVLGTWSASGRFCINVPLFNRPPLHPDVDQVFGDFTTVTLLECDVRPDDGIAGLARRLQEQLWQDLEHRAVSGVEVIREVAAARGVRADTFATVVFASAREQGRDRDGRHGPMGARWLGDTAFALSQTPQVLLDFQVYEDAGALSFNWDAVAGMFPRGCLADMFAACGAILDRLAADEAAWTPGGVQAVPAAHRKLVAAINATDTPVPDGYLFTGVLEQAQRYPDRTALIGVDGEVTFGQWYRHAAALAARLRAAGTGPGDLVAVAADKSAAQLVAALAVQLAGAAYLPVAPDLPAARQDAIVSLGRARQVLVRAGGPDRDWPAGVTRIAVDVTARPGPVPPDALPHPDLAPTDLAYVLFTSGSTGTPKGVMISHRAARNILVELAAGQGVGPGDRVLGLSALSFDLSVWDAFGATGAGAAVVLPPAAATRDPGAWLELMRRHRVTLWNSVPALMQMLLEHAPHGDPGLTGLRQVWLSGDKIPLSLPASIWSLAPQTVVLSLGGPTETTIWSVRFPLDAVDPDWETIPYGRPTANQRYHVLNDRLQQCPVWTVGELYAAGVGLAEGYWADAERTAAAFFPHPVTGERIYRTGDLGRWRPDGTIEILGRADGQVKIGGHRVEVGEIEATLLRHGEVQAAAVVVTAGTGGTGQLSAFVVPADPALVEVRWPGTGAAEPDGATTAGAAPVAAPAAPPGPGRADVEKLVLGDVVIDPVRRLEFTLARPAHRTDLAGPGVPLASTVDSDAALALWQRRASYREFADMPVPLATLAALLEVLRDIPGGVLPRHRYASAGSLYPVQVYLYAPADRVAELAEGGYYYDPAAHRLVPVGGSGRLDADCHVSTNRAAARAAAFQLFLVRRAAAIDPLYGNRSRDFCLIEAGLVSQLLEQTATGLELGLCQLGLLHDPDRVAALLRLDSGDEVLHTLLGGGRRPAPVPGGADTTGDTLAVRLRGHLAAHLPGYMLPAQLTVLDALPLSERGKVDRAALARYRGAAATTVPAQAPSGELEQAIARVVGEVLDRDRIGVTANFFDLGANSVQVVRVHRRLQQELGRQFPLIHMFEHTTVRRLAAVLAGDAGDAGTRAVADGFDRARRRREARQATRDGGG